MDTTPYIQNKR